MKAGARYQPGGRFSVPGVCALLLVLFFLSGRWSLSRVSSSDLGLVGEPRVYIVLALLFLVLSPGLRDCGAVGRRLATRTLLWVGVFYGYMALTAIWAPPGADRTKVAELGLVLVTVLSALRLCRAVGPARFSELLWAWFVPLLGFFALLGFVGVVSGGGRLAVLGGGPNVFGRNMGLLCVATLGLVLRRSGGTLTLGTMVLAGALVVLSGSRGALISTGLGVATLMYLSREGKRVVYVTIVAVVLATLVLQFTEFGAQAVEMFQHRVLRLALEDRYDSGRTDVYTSAWQLGVANPTLGIGLNGFKVLGSHIYPHNILLEVFCEGGLVGLALLAAVVAPALRRVVVRGGGPAPRDCAAFALLLMAAQFSGDLYDSRGVFLFAVLLPLFTPAARKRQASPRRRGPQPSRHRRPRGVVDIQAPIRATRSP